MDSRKIVSELNRHFSTNWSNENLRERVIEFGKSVYAAAIEDAANYFEEHYHCSACNPKEEFAAEIRKQKGDWHGNDPSREQQYREHWSG